MTGIRVSINAKRFGGPYGGGNQFSNAFEDYLVSRGYIISRQLIKDLDAILIVNSQDELNISSYGLDDISQYIKLHPYTAVIHRINSCDESHGSSMGINAAVMRANQLADYTIYISRFIRDHYAARGIDAGRPGCTIFNGAEASVFHSKGRVVWSKGNKMSIVTHHWSSNYMKGFDIYERLDQLLSEKQYADNYEYKYIGNVPSGVLFRNTSVIEPIAGVQLANLLRQSHIYITAARNEAGGMHQVEAMRCGLPVLYLNSGALPEYCANYGIEYNLSNFEDKLSEMRERYVEMRARVMECPYSSVWMAEQYEKVIEETIRKRKAEKHPTPNVFRAIGMRVTYRPRKCIRNIIRIFGKVKARLR